MNTYILTPEEHRLATISVPRTSLQVMAAASPEDHSLWCQYHEAERAVDELKRQLKIARSAARKAERAWKSTDLFPFYNRALDADWTARHQAALAANHEKHKRLAEACAS